MPPHFEVQSSQSDTLHSVELFWTSDRTAGETLPENKQHTRDRQTDRDIHTAGGISNPWSQQAKGRRATFQTARSQRLWDCEWRQFIRKMLGTWNRMWLLDARRVSAHSGGQETPVVVLLCTFFFTFENWKTEFWFRKKNFVPSVKLRWLGYSVGFCVSGGIMRGIIVWEKAL